MALRVVGFLAVGVVVGFALGGIRPRVELAERDREVLELKKRLERVDRPNPLRDLLPMFSRDALREARAEAPGQPGPNAPPRPPVDERESGNGADGRAVNRYDYTVIRGSAAQGQANQNQRAPVVAPAQALQAAPTSADPKPNEDEATRDRSRGFRSFDLESFDRLAELQRVRIETSRAALIGQAKLNEREVAEVDKSVKKMNDDLAGYGEEILVQASSEEAPSPSQALGLGHDVSGIMLDGQKRIEQILGPRSDKVDPEAMQVWNYIDLERLRPSAEKLLPAKAPAEPAEAQQTAQGANGPTTEQKP